MPTCEHTNSISTLYIIRKMFLRNLSFNLYAFCYMVYQIRWNAWKTSYRNFKNSAWLFYWSFKAEKIGLLLLSIW